MIGPVVVTGLGVISALGHDKNQFWAALCNGRSGIRPLTSLPHDLIRIRIGAEIPDYDPNDFFSNDDLPLLDRYSQFAVIAAREAVADAGLCSGDTQNAAGIIGTGCGGRVTDEENYQRLY